MTTTEQYKHEASGAFLYRELAQPHVETFSEVFEAWKPYAKGAFEPRYISGQAIADNLWRDVKATMNGNHGKRKHADQSMPVGPYCYRRDGDSLSVRCADWVLSRIRERTIIIGGDPMSFDLVDHDNGWTLVTAHHSSIVGSVWLAYIRTSTIPTATP